MYVCPGHSDKWLPSWKHHFLHCTTDLKFNTNLSLSTSHIPTKNVAKRCDQQWMRSRCGRHTRYTKCTTCQAISGSRFEIDGNEFPWPVCWRWSWCYIGAAKSACQRWFWTPDWCCAARLRSYYLFGPILGKIPVDLSPGTVLVVTTLLMQIKEHDKIQPKCPDDNLQSRYRLWKRRGPRWSQNKRFRFRNFVTSRTSLPSDYKRSYQEWLWMPGGNVHTLQHRGH